MILKTRLVLAENFAFVRNRVCLVTGFGSVKRRTDGLPLIIRLCVNSASKKPHNESMVRDFRRVLLHFVDSLVDQNGKLLIRSVLLD